MIEKLEVEISAKNNTKSVFKEVRDDVWLIEQQKQRLKDPIAINISSNLWELKIKLKEATVELKNLIKEWTNASAIEIKSGEIELLRKEIVLTNAELLNFIKTWNKNVSVLWNLFKSVTDEIAKSREEMIKLWKSTSWLDILESKASKLKQDFDSWKISAQKFTQELNSINKEAQNVWSSFAWIQKGLLWVASIIASKFGAEKFMWLSETFTSMNNSLKQVSEWKELDFLQKKILETANNSRVPIDSLTKSFVRFDLVNKQLWWTQAETLKMLDSLSKWLSMTWATTSEVSSVMLQLSQAFWSWKLAGDEFRAVSESMPSLLDILAKQLNVNRWELKWMASDWKITSEVLKTALLEANDQITESFNKSQKTIWQALTQIRNDFIIQFWDIDKQVWITEKIVSFFEILKTSLLWLMKNFPTLTIMVWWLTVALWLLWWAITFLWWPITALVWIVWTLTLWLGYASWIISEVQNWLWDLETKIKDNKTAQDDLKKAYDDWKISLEEYNIKSTELITTQEELKKKNEELEWSFSYMFASIVAWVKSSFKIFAWVVRTWVVVIWETIWNLIWFIWENLKLIPENFKIAFDNIPWTMEKWLKAWLKLVWNFINAITLWLWWKISKALWIWKLVDNINFNWSKNVQFKTSWIWIQNFKMTLKSVQDLEKEFDNFWKVVAKTPIIWTWNIDIARQWWIPMTPEEEKKKKGWKSAETIAKEKEKARIEELENIAKEEARIQIEAVNKSTDTAENKAKKIKKIEEDLAIKIDEINWNKYEAEKKRAEQSIRLNKEKEDELQKQKEDAQKTLEKTYEEEPKIFDKLIELGRKSAELITNFAKNLRQAINDIASQILEVTKSIDELNSKQAQDLWARWIKVKEELKTLSDKWASSQLANSIWRWTLENIASNSPWATIWWQKVEDLLKALDLQKELELINANTTEEQRKQSEELSKQSETEKILSDYAKQRADLLEKQKALEEQQAINKSIQNGWKVTTQQNWDLIQAFYTDEKGQLVEIQDLKNIQYAQDLQDKKTNLDTQLAEIKQNYADQLAEMSNYDEQRRQIETTYTEFLTTEADKRKKVIDWLISKMKELEWIWWSLGVSTSDMNKAQNWNTNNTTTDNSSISVNLWWVNVTNNADINYLANQIAKILISQKKTNQ